MNKDILSSILSGTYTLSKLNHRLHILKNYLLSQLFTKDSKESTEVIEEDLAWLKSLSQDFYKQFSKDNIYDIFEKIEMQLKNIPTLIMYLTFEPTDSQSQELGRYVRESFLANIILETKLNPELIGGCVLIWKGVLRDYSIREKINQKREVILADFKKNFNQLN